MEAAVFCKTFAPEEEVFWRYPSHKVLGIFEESEGVSKAIEALRVAGIPDAAIEVECGRSGEDHIDFTGKKHGIWAEFVRSMQELSAEHHYLDYYRTELHSNAFLLEVQVADKDKKGTIAQIMHDSGGKKVTYFGTWLIEEIANKAKHYEIGGYAISRVVPHAFEVAVDKVKSTLRDEGFGVLTEIDMKQKFEEKLGKNFDNYAILGACNPAFAYEALGSDLNLGLLLPCNVIVYEKDGETVVAAIDPVRMMSVAENSELNTIAGRVEEHLRRAIDRV